MDWTGTLLALLILPLLAVSVDLIGAARSSRVHCSRSEPLGKESSFEVLVPIYGDTRYLTNLGYLQQYGRRVILCTTSGETQEFQVSLREIAGAYGFRIFVSDYIAPPANGRRKVGGTVRDRVIRDALVSAVAAEYVVCLDADTSSTRSLAELVDELSSKGGDVASIVLVPQEGGPALVQLQRHEYRLAMRLRVIMPWLLSGACHVGRASAMRKIMEAHSLFFQGNDVEAGLLGERLGYRMTHIPFPVDTEVPARWGAWWRQRLAWAGGEFRLYIVNIRFGVWHPFFWTYGAVVLFAFFLFRWTAVLHPSWSLLAVAILYFGMIYVIHWKHRNRWLLVLPLYSLVSSLVILPLGIAWYFAMAIPERNYGIIRSRPHKFQSPASGTHGKNVLATLGPGE